MTKGVELEGNDLYYEMFDYYPHYQKIFSKRKAALNKFKRLSSMHGPNKDGNAKYKFE